MTAVEEAKRAPALHRRNMSPLLPESSVCPRPGWHWGRPDDTALMMSSRVEKSPWSRVGRQEKGKSNEKDAFPDCWHPKLPLSSLSISVLEPGAPPQGHRARACH